jgi:hypothetical protein
MSLSHERLADIGRKAATEIIGNVDKVEVDTGVNEEGQPAYYFQLYVDQGGDKAKATLLRTRLRQKIRDLLIDEKDERYPYVRFMDHRR